VAAFMSTQRTNKGREKATYQGTAQVREEKSLPSQEQRSSKESEKPT
jgi:hypothetical protein